MHPQGAVGEQATGELEALSSDWHVEHDVTYRYVNWDHAFVGPPGVFLLDTKNLRGGAVMVKDNAHRSGRARGGHPRLRGG